MVKAWGRRSRSPEHAHAATIEAVERHFVFRYRSPEHWLEVFRTYYGPMLKAFATLEPDAPSSLEQDLLSLVGTFNRADDGTMAVPRAESDQSAS